MTKLLWLPLWLAVLVGCATATVRAPHVEPTRTVQLLQHARHSSLLLTAADQSRVRYSYGDWAWYVEGEQGAQSALRALFADSQAGLGRGTVAPPVAGEHLGSVLGVGVDRAHALDVDPDRVDALIDALDREFASAGVEPHFSDARNQYFVPHPRPYRLGYNSNHMVADWLRELGVEVLGNPVFGRWRVVPERPPEHSEARD